MTTDALREKFEAHILKRVVGTPCEPYKDSILNRLQDNSYEQSWVDMQWEGYQAAHEELQGEIDALNAKLKIAESLIDFELMAEYEDRCQAIAKGE